MIMRKNKLIVYLSLFFIAFCTHISALNIEGTLYEIDETTPITGVGMEKTVALCVNSTYVGTDETDPGTGKFNFVGVTVNPGDTITFFLEAETEKANTVTISDGITNLQGFNAVTLIDAHVVLSSNDGFNPITISDLSIWDNDDSGDMLFTANSNILIVQAGIELYIMATKNFAPGGDVQVLGGDLDLNGIWNAGAGETITVQGSFDASGGAWNTTTETLKFIPASIGVPVTFNNITIYNIEVSGSSDSSSIKIYGTGTANNNFLLNEGNLNTSIVSPGGIDVKGDISISAAGGSISSDHNALITAVGSNPQIFNCSSGGVIPTLVVNKTPGTTLSLVGMLTIVGDLRFVSGIVDPGTSTVDFVGESSMLEGGSGLILYDMSLNIGNDTDKVWLYNTTTITGKLTWNEGNLAEGSNGKLILLGDVDLGPDAGRFWIALDNSAELVFSGSNPQTIRYIGLGSPGAILPKVTIDKTNPDDEVSLAGPRAADFIVYEDLTIAQGTLFINGHNVIMSVNCTFSNDGTLKLWGNENFSYDYAPPPPPPRPYFINDTNSGTWCYVGNGNSSGDTYNIRNFYHPVYYPSGPDYFNLKVDATDGNIETFKLAGACDIENDFNFVSGSFDTDSNANFDMNIAGNWNCTGNFIPRGGSVWFDGGGTATITGSATFATLRCTIANMTLEFEAGMTQTVNGDFFVKGGPGVPVYLRSTSDGSQWFINYNGGRDVYYVDVKDSNANGGNTITARDSIDSLNNDNWDFNDGNTVDITGVAYQSDGVTPITGVAIEVIVRINGIQLQAPVEVTNSADGAWSYLGLPVLPGDIVLVYLQGATERANFVTITDGLTDMVGVKLIRNHLTMRSDYPAGPVISIYDLAYYDRDDNSADMVFYANTGTPDILIVDFEISPRPPIGVIIESGLTFRPDGNVIIYAGPTFSLDLDGTWEAQGTETATVYDSTDFTGGTWIPAQGKLKYYSDLVITGSVDLYDLEFAGGGGSTQQATISAGTTLTVSNNLILSGPGTNSISLGGSGAIHVKKDVIIVNQGTSGGGSATIVMNGTGDQQIIGTGLKRRGMLPRVTIDKTSGTLTLTGGMITVSNDWTYIQGDLNVQAKIVFMNDLGIQGSHTLVDVEFIAGGGDTQQVNIGGTVLTLLGTLTIGGGNPISFSAGEIHVKGDVIVTNPANGGGGSTAIVFNGGTDQVFQGTERQGQARVPRITIDKPSGTLTLRDYISVGNDWTYIQGDLIAGDSTVIFIGDGDSIITGSHTLNDVMFNMFTTSSSIIWRIEPASILTVAGTLLMDGGSLDIDSIVWSLRNGAIYALGDVINANTTPVQAGNHTTDIVFTGSADQIFASTTGSVMPKVTINKPAGLVTVAIGDVECDDDLTLVSGVFDLNGSNLICRATSTFTSNNNATLRVQGGESVTFSGPGGFDETRGTVELNGSGSYDGLAPGFGGDFYNILCNGTGQWNILGLVNTGNTGGTVDAANQIMISSGTLAVGGTVTVYDESEFILNNTGILQLSDATVMTINAGGKFKALGIDEDNRVTITKRTEDAGSYTFVCNGEFTASWYTFEYMDSNGIDLTGAAITAGGLDNGVFNYGEENSPLVALNIVDNIVVYGCIFENSGSLLTPKNVTNSGIMTVTFYPSAGSIGGVDNGELYDDLLGDDVIIWVSPLVKYWVGGTGSWFDAQNHWAATTGGIPNEENLPTSSDIVIFDENSFPIPGQIVTINENYPDPICRDMDWSNATNSPTLIFNDDLKIYGSLRLASAMNIVGASEHTITFKSNSIRETITTGGHTLGALVFDGMSGEWTLQDNLRCSSLTISDGTLFQESNTITTTSDCTFDGGRFIGGDRAVYFSGGSDVTVAISGTDYTATSNSTKLRTNFTFSGGVFSPNNGKVLFTSSASDNDLTFNAGGISLYDMEVDIYPLSTLTLNGTLSVDNSLLLKKGSLDGGTINLKGDLTIEPGFGTEPATDPIVIFNGDGDQIFTGGGSEDSGVCPAISINKASGTLTLESIIRTGASWALVQGAVDPSTSTVLFVNSIARTLTGSMIFYNFKLNSADTLSLTAPVTVLNDLVIVSGTLDASGMDITVQGNWSDAGTFMPGLNTVTFTGSGASSISAETFNNVVIDKEEGGTVSIGGAVNMGSAGGMVNVGTSLEVIGGTFEVTGSLSLIGTSVLDISGATVSVGGDVTIGELSQCNITSRGRLELSDTTVMNIEINGSISLLGTDDANRAVITKRSADGGDYTFDCDGNFNAAWYEFTHMDINGIDLKEANIVSGGLDDGRFDYGTEGGPLLGLDVDSSDEVGAGNIIKGCLFYNSGNLADAYNVTNSGGFIVIFYPSGGTLGGEADGEDYDDLEGDDFIEWQYGKVGEISGIAYESDGITPLTETSRTVALRVNGENEITTQTNAGDGSWSFTDVYVDSNDTITVYLKDETEKANVVTITDAQTDITGVELVRFYVVLRADNGESPIRISNITFYDDDHDSINMLYDAEAGFPSTLNMKNYVGLRIHSDATFIPGGNFTSGVNLYSGIDLDGTWVETGTEVVKLRANTRSDFTGGTWVTDEGLVQLESDLSIAGEVTFYDLDFTGGGGSTQQVSLDFDAVITVEHDITRTASNPVSISGGRIDAMGPEIKTNGATGAGGSTIIRICGTGEQFLHGSSSPNAGTYPYIEIDKESGELRLNGTISAYKWTYKKGDVNPLDSTVVLYGDCRVTGTHTLFNLTFGCAAGGSTSANRLIGNTVITVLNDLSFLNTSIPKLPATPSNWSLDGGKIEVKGDLWNMNTASGWGSTEIVLNGTESQMIYATVSGTVKYTNPADVDHFFQDYEPMIYDGGDGWDTLYEDIGIQTLMYFNDADFDGVYDEASEDIWIDDVTVNGRYDTGETQVYDGGDASWGTADGTPGIQADMYYADVNGSGTYDAGEDIWLDTTKDDGLYDTNRIFDGGDSSWTTAGGIRGFAGLLNFIDTNGNEFYDSDEEIWLDENYYDTGEIQVYDGGSWTTADGTSGIQGDMYFYDVNNNLRYDTGEDIWLDENTVNGAYDSGETQVYNGGDIWNTPNGTNGIQGRIFFNDANISGSYDAGEDIWQDSAYYATDLQAYEGVTPSSWDTPEGTPGIQGDMYYTDANGNKHYDAGEEIWLDDAGVNGYWDLTDTPVYDGGDSFWDTARYTPGIQAGLYFNDANIDGLYNADEDIWAHINVYDAGETQVYDGGDGSWDTGDKVPGLQGNIYFSDDNTDGIYDAGEDIWFVLKEYSYNSEFPRVTVDKDAQSGTVTVLSGDLRFANNFTIAQGTVDINGHSLTCLSGSIFSNSGTLRVQGGERVLFYGPGGFDDDSGEVEFNGVDLYVPTLANASKGFSDGFGDAFYDVTFNGTGEWQCDEALTINGKIAIENDQATLDLYSYSVRSGGAAERGNIAGTIKLWGIETLFWTENDTDSGTYLYGGDGDSAGDTYIIKDFGATDYFNLIINATDGAVEVFEPGADIDMNGSFSVLNGTFDVSGSNFQMNVGGDWTNNDVFNAQNGTVILDGGDQKINGDTTFNNLTKDATAVYTVTFQENSFTTIQAGGLVTFRGDAEDYLRLRSTTAGTSWNFSVNAAAGTDIEFCDVQDSDASGGASIDATNNCVSSGGNTNWIFGPGMAIYRSVGPGNTTALADGTGGNTLEIVTSIATFLTGLPDNVGIGDAIQYDADGNGDIDSICFIHARLSSVQYSVRTASGAPALVTVEPDNDWAVLRSYTSLSDAANGDENTGINVLVRGFDTFAGGKDITNNDFNQIWEIVCYADGPDTAGATFDGWTTAPNYYLHVFSPLSPAHVGSNQRHAGYWNTERYHMEVTNEDGIVVKDDYVHIEGLQIKVILNSVDGKSGIVLEGSAVDSAKELKASHCVIQGVLDGATNAAGIRSFWNAGAPAGSVKIWNNVIYDFVNGGNNEYGIIVKNVNSSVYNNTAVDCRTGYNHDNDSGICAVKNNIVQGCSFGFSGAFDASSDYNCSDLGDGPGLNSVNGAVIFKDEGNNDFRLSAADTNAKDKGTDLSIEFVSDDIETQTRPGGPQWDIGADEYVHIEILNLTGNQDLNARTVRLSYIGYHALDWECDYISTECDYSLDSTDGINGTWFDMTRHSSDTGSEQFTSGGASLDFVWDVGQDVDDTYDADVWARIQVKEKNQIGFSNQAVDGPFAIDTRDPQGLSNLSVVSINEAILRWRAATEDNGDANFDRYEIWYDDVPGITRDPGTEFLWDDTDDPALAIASTNTTTITGLDAGTTYFFKIWAIDKYSNESLAAEISHIFSAAPFGGYTADNVIPGVNCVPAGDGSGKVTISFRIKDPDLDNCYLHSFQYSVNGGITWNMPANGDNSASLSAGWRNNNGIYYDSAIDWSGTVHSFEFDTDHFDVSGMAGLYNDDIQVRFMVNDGLSDSAEPVTSEDFIIDNLQLAVSFRSTGQNVPEDIGTAVTVILEVPVPAGLDVVIPFTVLGTATEGIDYTITPSPVIIGAGSSTASIVIDIDDDIYVEDNETIQIVMGNPDNAIQGEYRDYTVTIVDNDSSGIKWGRITTAAGEGNDRIELEFATEVDPALAETVSNYSMQDSYGNAIDLIDAVFDYNPYTYRVEIALGEAGDGTGTDEVVGFARFDTGEVYRVDVDLGVFQGSINVSAVGDWEKPGVSGVIAVDPAIEGEDTPYAETVYRKLEVTFSEVVDRSEAEQEEYYTLSTGVHPASAQLEPDKVTVRLDFTSTIEPGIYTLRVEGIADLAENLMSPVIGHEISYADTDNPEVISVQLITVSGQENDRIVIEFSEPVKVSAFEDLSATIRVVNKVTGLEVDWGGADAEYNADTNTVVLKLRKGDRYDTDEAEGIERIQTGSLYEVSFAGIYDLSGNSIADGTLVDVTAAGDAVNPEVVLVMQNTQVDPSGSTVDIVFSEAVDKGYAEGNGPVFLGGIYLITDGNPKIVSAELLDNGVTVRLVFDDDVLPGVDTMDIAGAIPDLAGNIFEQVLALAITVLDDISPDLLPSSSMETGTNSENDILAVVFSDEVMQFEAVDADNYIISYGGRRVYLTDSDISYDSGGLKTSITVRGGDRPESDDASGYIRLDTGESYEVAVIGIHDYAGNEVVGLLAIVVSGDTAIVTVTGVEKNLNYDSTGHTVAIVFSESIDSSEAEDLSNYALNGTMNPSRAELDGDEKTVRIRFGFQEVDEGVDTLDISGIHDLAGNEMTLTTEEIGLIGEYPVEPEPGRGGCIFYETGCRSGFMTLLIIGSLAVVLCRRKRYTIYR